MRPSTLEYPYNHICLHTSSLHSGDPKIERVYHPVSLGYVACLSISQMGYVLQYPGVFQCKSKNDLYSLSLSHAFPICLCTGHQSFVRRCSTSTILCLCTFSAPSPKKVADMQSWHPQWRGTIVLGILGNPFEMISWGLAWLGNNWEAIWRFWPLDFGSIGCRK